MEEETCQDQVKDQTAPNSSTEDSTREITGHDGVKGILTDKSANHLTSKHAHEVGIEDRLPPDPNQKPTKYPQPRTRLNKKNKQEFGDILEIIANDPKTEPMPDIDMRGTKGHYGENGQVLGSTLKVNLKIKL